MREPIPSEEFSSRTGAPESEVERYRQAGLLDLDATQRLFQEGRRLSVEEAAEWGGLEPGQMRSLLTALGFDPELGPTEAHLDSLAIGKQMMDAGLPWEAMIEGASTRTHFGAWPRPTCG